MPSPDRRQIATTLQLGKHKSKVLVIDVATAKEVASITVPFGLIALWGWNEDGIWFTEDYNAKAQPVVWQPGAQPVQLSIPNFTIRVIAQPTTDRVLVNVTVAGKECMEVGTLAGHKFGVCVGTAPTGQPAGYPLLSPDGRTMIHSQAKVAIDVATGKITKLQLRPRPAGHPGAGLRGCDAPDHPACATRQRASRRRHRSAGNSGRRGGTAADRIPGLPLRCDHR